MAYTHTNSKGVVYHLNSKDVTLKGGQQQTIYYFSKSNRPDTACESLPSHKVVVENPANGVPFCRNKK